MKKLEAEFEKHSAIFDRTKEKLIKVTDNTSNIKYAYVVFRSMEAMEKVMKAFEISCWRRCFLRCCSSCKSKEYKMMQETYFNGQWLTVDFSGLPEEIQWQHIKYSNCSRCLRKLITTLVAVALIVLGIIGITYLQNKLSTLSHDFKVDIECPSKTNKISAYVDQQKPANMRLGLMHCFCFEQLKNDPINLFSVSFVSQNPEDSTLYCQDWFFNYVT